MSLTTLITLSSCMSNCSYFAGLIYMLITIQSKSGPHMWWCRSLIIFIILLENKTNKIQHRSKVNYIKIFFVERVSSQTQQSSNFHEKDDTNLQSQNIFTANPTTWAKSFGNSSGI